MVPKPEEEKKTNEGEGNDAEEEKKAPEVPQSPPIYSPFITKEALYDFQITQVRIFPNSTRLMQVQDEPEYVF